MQESLQTNVSSLEKSRATRAAIQQRRCTQRMLLTPKNALFISLPDTPFFFFLKKLSKNPISLIYKTEKKKKTHQKRHSTVNSWPDCLAN